MERPIQAKQLAFAHKREKTTGTGPQRQRRAQQQTRQFFLKAPKDQFLSQSHTLTQKNTLLPPDSFTILCGRPD